ncbi:hypothetical protein HW114_10920 [Serratia symbiotica]|nr:hypothetical protein [Serratia symbiotica]MBQ0956291.1 hypothetical protein [Serratia symbiotica]QTP15459.1 hypothetical protein GPZ83_0006050 [Serratia symbiotica]
MRHRLSKGNDIAALRDAVSPMRSGEQRPLVVILDSIKRQGVAYQGKPAELASPVPDAGDAVGNSPSARATCCAMGATSR